MIVQNYGSYNSYSVFVQHHLDPSFLCKFGEKELSKLHGVIGLSIFNIYNQQNTYSREYFVGKTQINSDEIKVNDYTGLGFTSNAVVRVEW